MPVSYFFSVFGLAQNKIGLTSFAVGAVSVSVSASVSE